MPQIIILPHDELCPEGAVLDAAENEILCEVLLREGIEIEHACDCVCACTTCHVIVREGFDALNDLSENEEDLLDKAWGLTRYSRLSCQVVLSENDVVIEIPKYTINLAKEG